jgi:hypothetical protein
MNVHLPYSLTFAVHAGRWSVRRDEDMRAARNCTFADIRAEHVARARRNNWSYIKSLRWAREAQLTEHKQIRNSVMEEIDYAI